MLNNAEKNNSKKTYCVFFVVAEWEEADAIFFDKDFETALTLAFAFCFTNSGLSSISFLKALACLIVLSTVCWVFLRFSSLEKKTAAAPIAKPVRKEKTPGFFLDI